MVSQNFDNSIRKLLNSKLFKDIGEIKKNKNKNITELAKSFIIQVVYYDLYKKVNTSIKELNLQMYNHLEENMFTFVLRMVKLFIDTSPKNDFINVSNKINEVTVDHNLVNLFSFVVLMNLDYCRIFPIFELLHPSTSAIIRLHKLLICKITSYYDKHNKNIVKHYYTNMLKYKLYDNLKENLQTNMTQIKYNTTLLFPKFNECEFFMPINLDKFKVYATNTYKIYCHESDHKQKWSLKIIDEKYHCIIFNRFIKKYIIFDLYKIEDEFLFECDWQKRLSLAKQLLPDYMVIDVFPITVQDILFNNFKSYQESRTYYIKTDSLRYGSFFVKTIDISTKRQNSLENIETKTLEDVDFLFQ